LSGDNVEVFGLSDTAMSALTSEAKVALAGKLSSTRSIDIDAATAAVLLAIVRPRPRLLILGAGLDAEPVCRLASELGWRISVFDHRPAYIDNGDFKEADRIVCSPAAEMSRQVDLSGLDAAIVMSHHLETDRLYLAQLSKTEIPYIGLLGPKDRRKRLVEDLGDAAASLEGRLHGPAGLDIGAVGPAAIALSILAEAYELVAEGGS
jgi:xanthine/CO dehydrogenase XdhC/CoxF family maturation factor